MLGIAMAGALLPGNLESARQNTLATAGSLIRMHTQFLAATDAMALAVKTTDAACKARRRMQN